MDSEPSGTYCGRPRTRRALLAPLVGMVSASVTARCGLARPIDNPPLFRTGRGQFTLIEPAQSLPSVSLTRPDGQPVRLAAVPGKVMLINVWATWCVACRIDLPLLNRFHEATDARVWLTSPVHQCA